MVSVARYLSRAVPTMRFAPKYAKPEGYCPNPPSVTRPVSIGLELFRAKWNVSRVEQNVPTIFIIDGNGIVRFKQVSQSTMDRPSFDHIREFIRM